MDNDKIKRINAMLILIVSICIMAVIILIALWSKSTEKTNSLNTAEMTSNVAVADKSNNDVAVTYNINTEEMMKIKTPYCKLNYPKELSDNLKYEKKEENGVFSMTFYSCIKKQEIEMFTVYFGETAVGVQLGYIIKDGKKLPFRVDIKTIETDNTWTKKEKALLNDMTEGVNDIIISVVSNENYSEQ